MTVQQIRIRSGGCFFLLPFPYFIFFSVTVTGHCSRENCDVYASCLADPLSGIANCACQIGFIGDGLKCQGVYIFTS